MSRRVCVVTGTRADFGLLRYLMEEIKSHEELELKIIATGTHLSPEFGSTYLEIEEAGFQIDYKVEMLLSSDTASSVTKSVGLGTIGFADAYVQLSPDLIVVLGDRYELLSAVTAATIAGIPVAHLHGGETTEGAFDEAIRHAVTKMSHLHFVAAEEYKRRVIQLGEQEDRVFLVGGLGIDAIKRMDLLSQSELEESMNFKFGKKNLLITFHPVTLDRQGSSGQMAELLSALDSLVDTQLIFTMPNADTGNKELIRQINSFVETHSNSKLYASLGQKRYLSCLKYIDGVVGNSSSGLAEAPSMGVGTVNIGDRQKGRLSATSVLHCEPNRLSILAAIHALYQPEFRSTLSSTSNPYGNGGASKKIASVLASCQLEGILKKSFRDIQVL
ncbi:UDP-N-acetylglucosamine 2-epimerase [Limnobacter sp.]|uniref:UDP-N-acetylglucosamine 2-epimerase n=1 Tax=Limnobacter sp. TaxID=2003368 RepID=UPI00311DF370